MQDLNELIKRKIMSRQIRGQGVTVKKNVGRKAGCAGCTKKFDSKGN